MRFLTDGKRHLVCDPYSKENLHKMAAMLNIKRCHFHVDHYDIPAKRIKEIESVCELVPTREIVKLILGRKS